MIFQYILVNISAKILKTITYLSLGLLTACPLLGVDTTKLFIDIDEFSFKKSQQHGMRISIFHTKDQRFEAIDYHVAPISSESRKPSDLVKQCYGLKISYNCDVSIPKGIPDLSIRTKGKITSESKEDTIEVTKDEEGREIFFKDPLFLSGAKLMSDFNEKFGTNPYRVKDFNVTFFEKDKEPKRTSFNGITSNRKENSDERGRIGELATRLTMFFYGYRVKFISQNGSNQGMDGVYLFDHKDTKCLFFTESKCKDQSETPTKVMASQLSEKKISEKIQELKDEDRDSVYTFIEKHPKSIFKGVQRIVNDGRSHWLIEKFDYTTYKTMTISLISPPEEKQILFQNVQQNFKSPIEMIYALYDYTKITDNQRLEIFLATTSFPEAQKEQVKTLLGLKTEKPAAARKLAFDEAKDSPSAIAPKKEEIKKEIITIEYSREQLGTFLTYLKQNRSWGEIVKKLLEKDPTLDKKYQHDPNLTKFSNPQKYPNHSKSTDHEDFWSLLKQVYPKPFEDCFSGK